jgi:hypothetical protein
MKRFGPQGASALHGEKNSTPARPSASLLTSAPGQPGVDFFPPVDHKKAQNFGPLFSMT